MRYMTENIKKERFLYETNFIESGIFIFWSYLCK